MGCSNDRHDNEQCVLDIVKDVIDAQDEVMDDCCEVGCKQSINSLLSPATENNGLDTIPLMFICKGNCKYFIGSGVVQGPVGGSGMTFFGCFETPVFRAKKIVDGTCVVLELLQPQTEGGSQPGPADCEGHVCEFFPGASVRRLVRTGVCITVDLNCFCGVQCLGAVRAPQGSPDVPGPPIP